MFNSSEFINSIIDISREKQIDKGIIFEGIKEGIRKAYERYYDCEAQLRIDINDETGDISVFQILKVVEKSEDIWTEISISEANKKYRNISIGENIEIKLDINKIFTSSAVLKIGQIVKQKIREAEKAVIYNKYLNQVGSLSSGIVKDITDRFLILDVDGMTLSISNKNLIPGEIFGLGQRVMFYIEYVDKDNKFQQVGLTRTHSKFIQKLLEVEVPEIVSGLVQVVNISREPGFRSKISVRAEDENLDAVGCCIGQSGSRIKAVVKELNNEKVDIVLYDDNKETYIMNALSPARVISISKVEGEENQFNVIVPEEHISLTIGKRGNLIKIVARLVWARIDIFSLKQAEEKGVEVLWNGNITKEQYEDKNWINEKNFKNWGNNIPQNKKPVNNFKNNYKSNDILTDYHNDLPEDNFEVSDDNLINYDNTKDDFYDLDLEDYIEEEDEE